MNMICSQWAVDAIDGLYSLTYKLDHQMVIYPSCIIDGVWFIVKERDDQFATQKWCYGQENIERIRWKSMEFYNQLLKCNTCLIDMQFCSSVCDLTKILKRNG